MDDFAAANRPSVSKQTNDHQNSFVGTNGTNSYNDQEEGEEEDDDDEIPDIY